MQFIFKENPKASGQDDLFRARLDQMIDMGRSRRQPLAAQNHRRYITQRLYAQLVHNWGAGQFLDQKVK